MRCRVVGEPLEAFGDGALGDSGGLRQADDVHRRGFLVVGGKCIEQVQRRHAHRFQGSLGLGRAQLAHVRPLVDVFLGEPCRQSCGEVVDVCDQLMFGFHENHLARSGVPHLLFPAKPNLEGIVKAVMIDELGLPPVCRQIPDVQPSDGHEIARVRAAAIKNIERMLVAGTHYASTQLSLPAQVGMDAVAELIDGRRVYAGAIPPGGTMAEHMLVDPSMTVPVPDDVDDASAAALPNAGVSAWLSLEHTGQLRSGQSVLVPRTQPPGTTSPFR